jgi:CheY-like chemotaxis protein
MARVLIIDDDRLTREATRILLTSKGYTVVVAENGKNGIEAARTGQFDVAIVDLFMPDMDGLKVIHAIHAINPRLPLIAASGFMFGGSSACPDMPNFGTMAAEAGAVATLYKPFRPDMLIAAIIKAIGPATASLVRSPA